MNPVLQELLPESRSAGATTEAVATVERLKRELLTLFLGMQVRAQEKCRRADTRRTLIAEVRRGSCRV